MTAAEQFEIKGVPTLVVLNRSGQLVWKGRYCAYDFNYFECFLQHTISESLNSKCPVVDCDLCSNDLSIENEINGIKIIKFYFILFT